MKFKHIYGPRMPIRVGIGMGIGIGSRIFFLSSFLLFLLKQYQLLRQADKKKNRDRKMNIHTLNSNKSTV